MKPIRVSLFIMALAFPCCGVARDYGQQGEVFPILETDLLKSIAARLQNMKASGELARDQEKLKERTIAGVKRPKPVAGLSPATEAHVSLYDPSIIFDHDVHDTRGHLIVKQGQKVNPLHFLPFKEVFVFFDGDRKIELDYVLGKYGGRPDTKLVMTNGAPFDAMKQYHHRFYFDQGGVLTAKLGVRHTPTIVERSGDVLKLSEVPL